jgi:glycosyltransferase involved in cell wall biosynthesis
MDPLRIAYHTYAIANEAAGLAASDLVLCNSYFSRESLVRHYGINAKVNYLGVDADMFRPRKKEKQNLVLSVGRLSLLKGHEFCMRSLTCIDEARRPVLGIICGPANPNDKARINSTAVGLGVSIEIYEAITDDQLIDLYNSALVTLVAPVLEPFGLVPLESMACGTPVVAVAEGGIRESVVNGETGILTNRDEREFAEAIERIIGNSDLAREMGAVGREHVIRNWNWDSSIHCLKSQFDAVLSGVI